MTPRHRPALVADPARPSAAADLARGRSSDSAPVLLTVEQAAGMLAVPTSWLKQRVASHAVACTRLGRHIRFTHEQLAAIVTMNEQPVAVAPLTGLTRRSRRPA